MITLKRAYKDFKKYEEYIIYSVKSELKIYLSGTYLGYFWWLLDPLMYMLVYVLVVGVIFGRGGPQYPIFVFSALLPWKWTSSTITQSTLSIKSKAVVIQQVYLPKYILPLIKNIVNSVYFLFGLIMLLVLIPLFKVSYSIHIIEFIPILLVQFFFLFGLGLILAHLGVYFVDIRNILTFTIRLWFYLSPALYDVIDVPVRIRFLWYLNPMTTFYESYRNVFLYSKSPEYINLMIWFIISIIILIIGIKWIYKYDKNYTKVI